MKRELNPNYLRSGFGVVILFGSPRKVGTVGNDRTDNLHRDQDHSQARREFEKSCSRLYFYYAVVAIRLTD